LELDNKRTQEYTDITILDNLIIEIEDNNNVTQKDFLDDIDLMQNSNNQITNHQAISTDVQTQNQKSNQSNAYSMISASLGTLAGLATGYVYLLGGLTKKYNKHIHRKSSRKHKKTRKQRNH
jgi:hypothetical protein